VKISVCIPNYNYSNYISETLQSVLSQNSNFEIIVSDNCSEDDSISKIIAIADKRIYVTRNACNVGFAANLDRACRGATGDRMILLSSDDLAASNSLDVYSRLAALLGEQAKRSVFASDQYIIDGDSRVTGVARRDHRLWQDAVKHDSLSAQLGQPVFYVKAETLLRRSLENLRTPFAFATTCYPRELYEAVEGYGGGALMNPDKFFAWKLLGVADDVFYVETPLFSYRVHDSNQNAQQQQSGALKHLMDQYRATFDTPNFVLKVAKLSKNDLARSFITHDIALRGLKAVAENRRQLAQRHLNFGQAAYPELTVKSRLVWMLRIALFLGPIGTWVAKRRLSNALQTYRSTAIVPSTKEIKGNV
jgi:glycosyltransferase involved in cell wall biosynthesis